MNQFSKTACTGTNTISKEACIGIFSQNTPIRNYLNKLDTNYWDVLSYNAITKEICIVVYGKDSFGRILTTNHLSLTIPAI